MTLKRLEKIINRIEDSFGEKRKPVKRKPDLMDVLIATKLSQNTTDKTSYIAFTNLKKEFRKWEEVMNSPIDRIKKSIKVCGLANTKSANIKEMLNLMYKNFGNLSLNYLKKMSDDEVYEELLQYKGIGKKTISCVLAFGMGREVFPVDTHIHRILNRVGAVDTKTPDETFELSGKIIPDKYKISFHTNLIRFGRNVCKAIKPECYDCTINDLCSYKSKVLFDTKVTSKENNFIILENI
ncbi:MAG: endonuclease III [Ignavibacteriota bacterium]|nr:endonuclease III [Ignavibacteriota bacterium]